MNETPKSDYRSQRSSLEEPKINIISYSGIRFNTGKPFSSWLFPSLDLDHDNICVISHKHFTHRITTQLPCLFGGWNAKWISASVRGMNSILRSILCIATCIHFMLLMLLSALHCCLLIAFSHSALKLRLAQLHCERKSNHFDCSIEIFM